MKFLVVMGKTIGDLMGLKRTLALVFVGLTPVIFISLASWRNTFQSGTMSLEMQTHFLLGYFIILVFLWLAGFFLAYLVVGSSGQEFVAKEEEKGTLLLMVSKPISRFQFLLGKFLGLVLTSLLLELIVLFSSVLLFWGLLGLDPDTISALMSLIPWIFLFSILVTLLFAAISIALSALFKNDIVRSLLLALTIMLVFGLGPMLRMIWPSTYEDYSLYYIDGSYNLGNAYVMVLDQAESGRMTPQYQAWLGITTGAYRAGAEMVLTMFLGMAGSFDPEIGAMPPSIERTNYLNPAVSILLCLLVTVAAFGVATVALNRKEVH